MASPNQLFTWPQCHTQVSAHPSCPPLYPFLPLTSCSAIQTSLLSSYSRLRALTQAALLAWKAPPQHLIQYLAHSRCLGKKEELGILLLEELRACHCDSSRGSKMMSQDFIPVVLRGVSWPDLSLRRLLWLLKVSTKQETHGDLWGGSPGLGW